MEFLVVQFKKCDLNFELSVLSLGLPGVDLLEHEVEHSRNNTYLFKGHSQGAARSHRVSLTRTCLSVGQNGRVETMEAAKHEITCASVEDVFLFVIWPKHSVKAEGLCANNYFLSGALIALDNAQSSVAFSKFPADEGPNSDSYCHRASILCQKIN